MEVFNCFKCGICCRDIIDNIAETKRGLTLTVEEAALFPDNLIAPLAAIGWEEPDFIFLYQLKANNCPFIDQDNKCLIYESRPLVCRSFPLTQGSYSTKCKLFRFLKDFPENSVKVVLDWGKTQLDAEKNLDSHIINSFKRSFVKGIGTWFFDLASEQWKLKKRYYALEETIEF